MKVLFINLTCGSGSTGRIITDQADYIKLHGFDSYFAYGFGNTKRTNSYKVLPDGLKYSFRSCLMYTRITGWHGFNNDKNTIKLLRWIDSIQPDIIHLHNIHGGYVNVSILFEYLKKVNIPVVWTLHDCWGFTGRCAYFDYIQCDKWLNGCNRCPNLSSYPKSYFIDKSEQMWLMKKDSFLGVKNLTLVTPSMWLKTLIENSFLSTYPTLVIHNGIDTNTFCKRSIEEIIRTREKYNLLNKFVILGVANSWSKRKGLDYFIELSQLLNDSYKIVIVGVNEKQKRLLPRNILPILRTDSVEELVDLYSCSDVFVNPTLEDNYPTTNLEAQACGIPVITFDTGGSAETVLFGRIAKEKTVQSLIEEIRIIQQDKELPHRYENYNFNTFSKSVSSRLYLDLYKRLV